MLFAVLCTCQFFYIRGKNLETITTIICVLAFAYIIHAIDEKYKNLLEKKSRYRCNFAKNVIPFGDQDHMNAVRLQKTNIVLPFPPMIGMSVKEYLNREEKKDESGLEYIDGDNFFSGRITHVVWNGFAQFFDCTVEPHRMSQVNKLPAVLHHHIQEQGWELEPMEWDARKELEAWVAEQKANAVANEARP